VNRGKHRTKSGGSRRSRPPVSGDSSASRSSEAGRTPTAPSVSEAHTTATDATHPPAPPAHPRHCGTATSATSAGSPGLRRRFGDLHTLLDHCQHRLIALFGHAQLPEHRPTSSAAQQPRTGGERCQASPETASTISRSRCQASAEAPSSITRSSGVKHQPKQYKTSVGPVGIEPTTRGLKARTTHCSDRRVHPRMGRRPALSPLDADERKRAFRLVCGRLVGAGSGTLLRRLAASTHIAAGGLATLGCRRPDRPRLKTATCSAGRSALDGERAVRERCPRLAFDEDWKVGPDSGVRESRADVSHASPDVRFRQLGKDRDQ
jgi:hypothetical protein